MLIFWVFENFVSFQVFSEVREREKTRKGHTNTKQSLKESKNQFERWETFVHH